MEVTGTGPARPSDDDWTLPDDGIVDWDAVRVAAMGWRKVCLTPRERRHAVGLACMWGEDLLSAYRRLYGDDDRIKTREAQEGDPMRKQVVTVVDDLDGSEATQTVRFGVDGSEFEVDLSDPHAEELTSVLRHYASVARKIPGNVSAPRSVPRRTGEEAAAREWLSANGYHGQVPERGRVPRNLMDAYRNRMPAQVPNGAESLESAEASAIPVPRFTG